MVRSELDFLHLPPILASCQAINAIWKRLKRSKVHAEAFWDEFKRLFPKDGYTVRLEKEDERTWVAHAIFSTPMDEDLLSLELGEFFYQLRSALDALIWKAVWITQRSEPPADANRLEFPICGGPNGEEQFKKAGIHKYPFPQELRNWIGGIQPYSAEKSINDPDCGLSLTLQAIHDCARKDRHRRLHVVAAVPQTVEYDFLDGMPPGVALSFADPIDANFLKGKNAFLRFGLVSESGVMPAFKGQLATALNIDISVDEVPKWTDQGFGFELHRFGVTIQHVINHFESFFFGATHAKMQTFKPTKESHTPILPQKHSGPHFWRRCAEDAERLNARAV